MNGYNFTEQMRRSLALSREEAAALSHPFVGTEHELLGVLSAGESIATVALQNLGVSLDELRAAVNRMVEPGSRGTVGGPDLPYTSRAKKVLELAMLEARALNHNYVGNEHLLMGLVREQKGVAARALAQAGVTADDARAEILRLLAEPTPSPRGILHASPLGAAAARDASMQAPVPQYAERVRAVLAAAHDVAKRCTSAEIRCVHAAIALLEHGHGAANAALDAVGFRRSDALSALEALAPDGGTAVGPDDVMTLATDLGSVMESVDARNHGRGVVPGTPHLLLGILGASTDVAGIFAQQQVTEEVFRNAVSRISG
jgi:ATP-dependent Clp protease ATP-binding subunit ClpA